MKALKPRGFTLIEILISLTIMVLVFGVGFAGYRDFSRGQNLERAARELRTNLRLAQSIAFSGTKPSSDPTYRCTFNPPTYNNVLNGVSFSANPVTDSYAIQYDCSGGSVNIDNFNAVGSLLSQGIDLTRTGTHTSNSFTFKTLGQGTTMAAGANYILNLRQISTNKTISVEITSSGEIK